jgi:hypothetical protein
MNCYEVLSFLGTELIVEAADLEVIAPSMRRTMLLAIQMVRKRKHSRKKTTRTLATSD